MTLPNGWTVDVDRHDLVRLQACDAQGRPLAVVTVDEIARNFVLGFTVRVPDDPDRKGRGWQARLFADAIVALQAVIDRAGPAASSSNGPGDNR